MRSYMKERKENRLFYLLNHTEEIVIVAMFAVMVAVIFVQVIMRKCGNSLTWSEELGKFLFVWITWLGISLGERKGEHIKITMLTDRLPFRVAQVVNILSEIIVIIVPLHFTTESRWCFPRWERIMRASRSAFPGVILRWLLAVG